MTSGDGTAGAPEPGWARRIRRTLDAVAVAALWLSGAILVAVLVLMNVEIVTRYLFGTSTLIADEYAGYGFAVLVLSGFIYAHRRRAFLRVEFAAARLRGRPAGRILLAVAALLSVVLSLFAAYAGYQTLSLSWLFGSTSAFASETPLWIPQAMLPIGFLVLALSFAEEALRHLLGLEA